MQSSLIAKYMSLAALIWLSPWAGGGQAQSAGVVGPQFEVSSVKQNVSQGDESNISSDSPDRFVAMNVPVRFLVLYAYGLMDHQLAGAPEWTFDRSFDVVGTYPGHRRPSENDIRLMLQNLLSDRFGLKVHREQRELPAYDLVLARKDGRMGPQFQKSNVDCAARIREKGQKVVAGDSNPAQPSGKRPICTMTATRRSLTGAARTMQDLTGTLQSMLRRPVVDRTGLGGVYDIELQWAPTDLRAGDGAASSEGPSIFTALQEQLGLKLVSHGERFDVLVVDKVKQPEPD